MALNEKQELFAREYIKDLNATQAAIRAGYSEKTAKSQGQRLLTHVDVQALVIELFKERTERLQVDSDYVLQRLVDIDQMDVLDVMNDDGSLKPLSDWPLIWRQFLTAMDVAEIWEGRGQDKQMVGLLKKIKWPDKLKNLEMIGKHIGVSAFSERRDHKHQFIGADGKPMKMAININFVTPGEVAAE